MNHSKLKRLIFYALCCDLGLFSKRLIAPAANIITEALHIPGGIGTSFSLMFLVIAASLSGRFGCATLMGAVQSLLAIGMGMVGSMGALSPIGYIVPGLVIDCIFFFFRILPSQKADGTFAIPAANMLAAVAACLTANLIVFRLRGVVLLLYASVSATTGFLFGLLGIYLVRRLRPVLDL